jgi:hypothetical protein
MKKLFSISTIAFILLSIVATSCEKENPGAAAPVPAPVPMTLEATTTFTPKGSTKPIVTKGDVDEGEIDATYSIVPKLAACNCNGKWTYLIDKEKNTETFSIQNIHNGTVTFIPHKWGTYKVTITYTCPGGAAVSVTVSITAK